MAKVYTDASAWAAAVRRWETREKDKPIFTAMRRAGGIWTKLAILDFGSRGVGAKVVKDKRGRRRWWGISFDRTKKLSDTRFESGLLLFGLAAHQEQGTRTEPHPISGKGNNPLVFEATGRRLLGLGRKRSGLVAVKQVKHPGGPVPRYPFAARTARLVEPRLREMLQAAVVDSYTKTVG